MSARKFRKKPVVIEARQLSLAEVDSIREWCGGVEWVRPLTTNIAGLTIPTLEGDMTAAFGDWIVKGVEGEFYPVKDSIFQATYEVAIEDGEELPVPLQLTPAKAQETCFSCGGKAQLGLSVNSKPVCTNCITTGAAMRKEGA